MNGGSSNFTGGNNLTHLNDENTSLKYSLRISTDIEKRGSEIIEELDEQKSILDRVMVKVNTMANKLGIANSITHFLIRRGRGDTLLCIILGILTIVIIYYVYYHVKPYMKSNSD